MKSKLYDSSYSSFHRKIRKTDIAVNGETRSHTRNRQLPKDGHEIYLFSKELCGDRLSDTLSLLFSTFRL